MEPSDGVVEAGRDIVEQKAFHYANKIGVKKAKMSQQNESEILSKSFHYKLKYCN